jgi:NADPH:quinone reductase-like Zn-dependent oxidoreductase
MPESSVMRALVVDQPGGPEAMRMGQLPAPRPGPGQVVVAVEAVGVNPVDAGNRADPGWSGVRPPYVVGYELAGRIQAVGDGAAGWTAGDPVWGLLPVRGTRWGTYAEQVALDAGLVGPRPPGLGAVEAASLPLAGATAVQLLERLDPRPGEWLLVHGAAGGVGSLLVQLARGRAHGWSPRPAPSGRRSFVSSGRRSSWTAILARWPSGRAAGLARTWT